MDIVHILDIVDGGRAECAIVQQWLQPIPYISDHILDPMTFYFESVCSERQKVHAYFCKVIAW